MICTLMVHWWAACTMIGRAGMREMSQAAEKFVFYGLIA
jgi:hypothetical protein